VADANDAVHGMPKLAHDLNARLNTLISRIYFR